MIPISPSGSEKIKVIRLEESRASNVESKSFRAGQGAVLRKPLSGEMDRLR